MRLSLCIIGQNQASRIGPLLTQGSSVADEIVYVDGGSQDNTREVLSQFPKARMVVRKFDGNFASQRNAALDAAKGEWVLFVDTDELLGPNLVQLLPFLMDSNFNSVNIPRYWLSTIPQEGKPQYVYSDKHYPDLQLRMFRNRKEARYDEKRAVHETLPQELRKPCLKLRRAHLLHYCFLWLDRAEREKKVSRYESIQSAGINAVYLYEEFPHSIKVAREGFDSLGRAYSSTADVWWEKVRLKVKNP